MQVVHVFEEEDRKLWKHHMKAFFGVTPETGDDYNPEDQSYIVCYCGGRLRSLGDNSSGEEVCAVWHNKIALRGENE